MLYKQNASATATSRLKRNNSTLPALYAVNRFKFALCATIEYQQKTYLQSTYHSESKRKLNQIIGIILGRRVWAELSDVRPSQLAQTTCPQKSEPRSLLISLISQCTLF
jgi:hypothetical protein